LAFEGHRFWDVRRWKEADKFFKSIDEMKITRNPDGSFTYTRRSVNRIWDDKMYLFPIPQVERMKNPNLGQNPGW
ncbi:MAG TPA: RagB/SusD family nutrient uptake outer membrane protein, partial [Porphyromonadaceae bacterium]|nr:RagB/SusD family nutrient uptake outer membrane protein [Porphyromonadaceae bacterium]